MGLLKYFADGGSFGRVAKPKTIQVDLFASEHVHCTVDFEPDSSAARIVFVDDDRTVLEVYTAVRQITPALREIAAAFEARLEELPA